MKEEQVMTSSTITDPAVVVTGGIDTHADTHVAAALDQRGRLLGTRSFPSTPAGHRDLMVWLASFGTIDTVGVEGTGAWGAGIARHLATEGVRVVEVDRPNRAMRHRRGKSDTIDAEAAARAVQAGTATGTPKTRTGLVEGIRALRVARRAAVKDRTAAAHQLRSLVTTAPDELRSRLRDLSVARLVSTCAGFRPADLCDPTQATKAALRSIARRYQHLDAEIDLLDTQLEALVRQAAPPSLLARPGVGIDVAGQLLVTAGDNPDRLRSAAAFAHLCGVAPIPVASGRSSTHRLNRGGDRAANAALYRIVITRLRWDPTTRAYLDRKIQQGKTKKGAIRCLKHFIAREIYNDLRTITT
jgi:transposase